MNSKFEDPYLERPVSPEIEEVDQDECPICHWKGDSYRSTKICPRCGYDGILIYD